MPASPTTLVFVHGWSVTHTDTYGELPARLRAEATAGGVAVRIEEVFLGRYVSFHDEVRLEDIARAFQAAVEDRLGSVVRGGERFACITHSTGGPVIRDWWQRFHAAAPARCPMSHLIMLAPANYGSALAQLGKGRLSRLKSWFGGVEPGQGVLDWLELGSAESWDLNSRWIRGDGAPSADCGFFPFVITGQSIDRAFYDHLNSYTGEPGSDGVVRAAAANLRGAYLRLEQETPRAVAGRAGVFEAPALRVAEFAVAPPAAFLIAEGRSHAGRQMGIMRSVRALRDDAASRQTVDAILRAIDARTPGQYAALCAQFDTETAAVQERERLETETRVLLSDRHFIHDRYAMVVFRVRDDRGHPVTDYDLLLTAGADDSPDHLPTGFFVDRQRNSRCRETITYYLNYDVMTGAPEVRSPRGELMREPLAGTGRLGVRIAPRPAGGFVHYLPCAIAATSDLLRKALRPNGTTLIDIRLRRIVRKNVFRVHPLGPNDRPESFKQVKPGEELAE